MDRKKIKKEARAKIKGNIWTILLPFIVIGLVSGIISSIMGPSYVVEDGAVSMNDKAMIFSGIVDLLLTPLSFGCIVYVLKFVRNEEVNVKIVFEQFKKFWPIFCLYFLLALFIGLWSLLFIIPGIIAEYKYMMAPYIMADGEEDAMESIRKSKAMMNGYKWDFFKFQFSFFWWYLLVIITVGIGAIYVVPYVTVAQTMYYEELKKATNTK